AEIVPSTIEVLGVGTSVGVLTIETGATLLCDAGSTMVADGGTIVINGVAQLNCDGASLRSSNKGQVSLAQNLTVSSGAFIGGNGVFSIGDNVVVTYDSDTQPSIAPGATFRMGDDALFVLDGSSLLLAGTSGLPVVFEAAGSNPWSGLEV